MASQPSETEPELLSRFISLLKEEKPITLPRETVLGAISHYISTLPLVDLGSLLEAVSKSAYLWDNDDHASRIREAIKLGISGAIDRLASEPGSSRWWRRADSVSAWLDGLCGITMKLEGGHSLDMMVALLSGASAPSAKNGRSPWTGKARAELEDEIILGMAGKLEETRLSRRDARTVAILCEVLEAVDEMRIRVLGTQAIQMRLLSNLSPLLVDLSSASSNTSAVSPATLSRSIARMFSILNEGDSDHRAQAWIGMRQFCIQMRGVMACIPPLPPVSDRSKARSDQEVFDRHKTALSAFLLPSSASLSIILQSEPPSPLRDQTGPPTKAEIATESLHTLSAFAAVLDRSEGGLKGYHRVLHGMTDVLVASGGTEAVKDVFRKAPASEGCTPAEGAWWLNFGESVIRQVDQGSYEAVLSPMIERFIVGDTHRSSFEAAHSLRLATIQAAADTLDTTPITRKTYEADVTSYADLLITQYTQDKLTNDQFRAAFPLLIEAASRYSDHLVDTLLHHLRNARAPLTPPEIFGQTRRLVLISSAPHTASSRLGPYLDALAREIMSTPASSPSRVELTGAAFRMVMHDLGDSVRLVGMEWWTLWRDRFQGVEMGRGEAKL